MKLAMVGIGDIARKAYLPTMLSRQDIDLYLVTRNQTVLDEVGRAHGIVASHRLKSVRQLLGQKIDAALVHAATDAHDEIVRELLRAGVHVYVDKPLDYSYDKSREMVALARCQKRILMVGFNRRYAPLYQEAREDLTNPAMVLMQKNRANSPQSVREAIFDDFIHVVDTIRSFLPSPVQRICVQGRQRRGALTQVAVHMIGLNYTAMGVMNRINGADEEVLDVMGDGLKWSIREMRDGVRFEKQKKCEISVDAWSTVEKVKGFSGIVDEFLALVGANDLTKAEKLADDALETHRLCEDIVRALQDQPEGVPS